MLEVFFTWQRCRKRSSTEIRKKPSAPLVASRCQRHYRFLFTAIYGGLSIKEDHSFTTIAKMAFKKTRGRIKKKFKNINCWLPFFTYLFYGISTCLNISLSLSIPFTPAPYTFVARIEFNEYIFDGFVNDVPVQGLTLLSVSLATFC